ncbi:MAG: 3-oxoacyl-[acyl-carrier-protein] reductase [Bacteroidia bacterium]|nr:3-oxoacyl-[acyl-carrier-protein] reductase [Bacteroidia bacterium]
MTKLLEGKTAIITGGTRGIGKAIVLKFAENGANVAFTYSSSAQAAIDLENEIKQKFNVKIKGYKSDASVFAEANELVENITKDFGEFHVLVNNAGITRDNLLMRMSEDQWDEIMQVNLKSVFNMTKASVRNFLKIKGGSIINMSSVVGVNGNTGQSNYSASKAGIIGFSKSIAKELGSRNVRCNAIAPGFIQTEMTEKLGEEVIKSWAEQIPLKRGGTTVDVANLTLFLASDLSSYITGQVLSVCGGMLM